MQKLILVITLEKPILSCEAIRIQILRGLQLFGAEIDVRDVQIYLYVGKAINSDIL